MANTVRRTLIQASLETRSLLQELQDRLPHLEYRETKYWATFRSKTSCRAVVQLNPQKQRIRLFLSLDPSDDPQLQPSPSTDTWGDRFRSVFYITGENDLPTAARLIIKSIE